MLLRLLIISLIFTTLTPNAYSSSQGPKYYVSEDMTHHQTVQAIITEAANQGQRGMQAVACAILNGARVQIKPEFVDRQVLYMPELIVMAEYAISDALEEDIVGGANRFENLNDFPEPPDYHHSLVTVVIGDHTFWRSE